MKLKDIQRLLNKAEQSGDCWIWQGAQSSSGYGNTYLDGEYLNAHVAMFRLFGGVVTKGEYVLHSCDNKLCINPGHLSAGSPSQNVQEALQRGRINKKFTDEQIREIRDLRKGGMFIRDIALKFGCSKPLIEKIIYGGCYEGVR